MRRTALLFLFIVPVWAQSVAVDSLPVKVGLALSGGAALGMAHIGVLKVLEQEGIGVGCISGNSMGSIMGGLYSAGYSAAQIESAAVSANWGKLFSSSVPFGARYLPERQQVQRYIIQLRHRNLFPSLPSGLVSLQNVEFFFMQLLASIEYNTDYDFDSLPIPYRAVAVDLVSGHKVILKRGRLSQAIRASIAIPGVFAPEKLGKMELVDGGVQQNLPVEPLLEYKPDFIIAVLTMKHNPETGISLIDIASRSMDIIGTKDIAQQKALADVVIEPNVDPFKHSDFALAKGLIAAGEAAAKAALPEIRRKLAGRKPVAERKPVRTRPLSVVRSVSFEGLQVTRESMLRPLMQTRSGRYLMFDRLRKDLVRIFNTGLFEDVNYRLDRCQNDSVDVVVSLQERAYGFYYLGIRYDNVDNLGLGLEVGQGNLWGSGASIRGVLQLGDPTESRLGLTGTRLFKFPFGYRLDGFWGKIDRSFYELGKWRADYTSDYRGGIAEAGYILGRDAFFDIGMKACQVYYRVPDLPFFQTLPKEEWNWIIGPSLRFEFNSFNELFIPTRGLNYKVRVLSSSRTLKADRDFLKVEASSERILPLGSRLLFRPGWELGFCLGDSAWFEWFHCGAENLRGFARDEFTSPNKAIVKLSMDFLLLKLFHQENYPVYLQLFSNLASFRRLDSLIGEPDFQSGFDWSAGFGVLTNSPVGPFRLTFGVADFWKHKPDCGTRFNLFVSVGREFRYTR